MRICLLLFLSLASFFPAYSQGDEPDALIRKGIQLHDAKDYEGALKVYDEVIQKYPDNFLAYYEKTYSLSALGKNEECIQLCKSILKQFPKEEQNYLVYINYGTALDVINKPSEAISVYSEGIKKFPNSYLLWFNRGITQYNQGSVDKASADFQQSVSLNPLHASSHQSLAYSVYKENRIAAAMALSAFLLIEPEGPRAEKNLKMLLQLLNSNVKKEEGGSITISLSPDMLKKSKKKQPDDFSIAEMTLTMQSALNLGEKGKLTGPAGNLQEKFQIFADISVPAKKSRQGFFSKFYVPFFKQMEADSLLRVASYLAYASSSEEEIQNWLEANKEKTNSFYGWLKGYAWVKE